MYMLDLAYAILENEKLNADVLKLCLDAGTTLKVKKGTREDMRKDNLPRAGLPLFNVSGLMHLGTFLKGIYGNCG